ncbi:MAG: CHASE2 domain-containing protein [Sphingorhabdus sp.]
MNLRLRLAFEWLLIGGIASLIVVLALGWRGAEEFDNIIYDQIASASRPVADQELLIVAIDDRSLAEIGKWPWPRDIHAQMFGKLKDASPRSVAFDILISEPSGEGADAALAEALAGNPPVFIPLHFASPGTDGRPYDTELPIPEIAQAAAKTGHVNLSERDEVVRTAALCFDPQNGDGQWPHLIEYQYRAASGGTPSPAFARSECGEELIIPYASRGGFSTISYVDLLRTDIPESLIKGRDVIIGATATGMGDSHPVPFASGGQMPGVEIMANMLSALKQDSFIRPIDGRLAAILSILPIWLLLFAFLRFRPRMALISSVIFIALILLGSALALGARYWFPPGAALIGILLIYPLWGWRRLQAMSDFMDGELQQLDAAGDITPLLRSGKTPTDIVGRQSAALSRAIDHIRDLRRFVTDVLSDLPDPMVVTNRKGKVRITSDLVEERLGQEIIGFRLGTVMEGAVRPENLTAVREFLEPRTDDHGADEKKELDYVRFGTNDDRTYVMRRSPVRSDDNEYLGDVYYLADISALATAEAQREEVLQLLSHDMRAPQSAIIAALDGKLDQTARKRIERNARRTMRLAQDFVDMARMAETEFEGEDILLADLARDVADNLWPLAEERHVKFKVDDRSNAAFVLAEPDAMSRAISNLLDNAIKFSPEGSVIELTLRRVKIDGAAQISLTISDHGAGIDSEILPRLFTKFASSDKEKRRAKGIGLGLAYVETVATRHSGTIRAENRKGGGADFILMLPEAAEEAEAV